MIKSGTRFRITTGETINEKVVPKGRSQAIKYISTLLGLSSHDTYVLSKDDEIEYEHFNVKYKVEILETKPMAEFMTDAREISEDES